MNPLYNKAARRAEHFCSTIVTGGMIASCVSISKVCRGVPVGEWLDASMDAPSFIPAGSVKAVGYAGVSPNIVVRAGDENTITK